MLYNNKHNTDIKVLNTGKLAESSMLFQAFNNTTDEIDSSSYNYLINNRIYNGTTPIGSFNLLKDSEKLLVRRLVPVLGGKKKKEAKTGAKKGDGQRKKTPKSILKHFKLTGKGLETKVEYLKKDCNGLDCGVGFGCAKHADKTICGKCGKVSKLKKTK